MMKVSKAEVNYRESRSNRQCANCSMYRGGVCTLVKGRIEPDAVCDRWEEFQ